MSGDFAQTLKEKMAADKIEPDTSVAKIPVAQQANNGFSLVYFQFCDNISFLNNSVTLVHCCSNWIYHKNQLILRLLQALGRTDLINTDQHQPQPVVKSVPVVSVNKVDSSSLWTPAPDNTQVSAQANTHKTSLRHSDTVGFGLLRDSYESNVNWLILLLINIVTVV